MENKLIWGITHIRVKIYGLIFSIIKFVSSIPLILTTCCLTTLNPLDLKNGLAVMLTSANTRLRSELFATLKTSFIYYGQCLSPFTLTQRQLSEILDTSTGNVGLHLKNIYTSGELVETATTEDFPVVQQVGKRSVSRKIRHYNLDAIISVAYHVNSKRGTQFRQWATATLGLSVRKIAKFLGYFKCLLT